jgi:nucleotide-binding universal stress UspA family protein
LRIRTNDQEPPMDHPTLLCHMELNSGNDAILAATADLASVLGANVIGIAACQPLQPFGDAPYAGAAVEADIAQIRKETKQAEHQFRAALEGKVRRLGFRSAATYQELADYIAGQARAADFVLTGPALGGALLGETRRTNIGDLVMNAGRAVVIVPSAITGCLLEHAVIAWKDRREARRAVADALPLLKCARRVTVAEVARNADTDNAERRTQDVAAWLQEHGVAAQTLVEPAEGSDIACLHRILDGQRCDFLVAGAYSHSRIGEWAFGGITTDLLMSPDRCTLVSH